VQQIKFIEAKQPDMGRVGALLELCAQQNHWANRGPLYAMLRDNYAGHLGLAADRALTPCANGGIALEAMSRLLGQRAGRSLRWVGPAFGFHNLGRGHFANMTLLDCTAQGLLDLAALRALDPDSFDGLVLVNPFGLFTDISDYIAYARETGKALLIDNAAGLNHSVPDWPWQSFSLHQTKPYGAGEGGLALTPTDAAEELYALLNYGALPDPPSAWLNNGKISDIACAFLIDRLERVDDWAPRYLDQAERVHRVATQLGLAPVRPFGTAAPATSWAYLAPDAVPLEKVAAMTRISFGKYYKPLADLPRTTALYERLVNIPTHPDMAAIGDDVLAAELEALLS